MSNINEKMRKLSSVDKNKFKIYDYEKTQLTLKVQINVLRKIISSWTWLKSSKFTDCILYEISKYLFRNPLSFITPVYKHLDNSQIGIKQKKSYILMNVESGRTYQAQSENSIESVQKSLTNALQTEVNGNSRSQCFQYIKKGEYSLTIKIVKIWKNCKINYENTPLKQIINKSKHMINFLKNIVIDHPKQVMIELTDCPWQNNENQENKQNKLYTLICQNYDYILNKISQIQNNQKLKKLDHSIARTYVQMMNKNIVIFSVQSNNNNPVSYKSQGKYIYFQNSIKIPLFSQRFNRIYGNIQAYKMDKQLLMLIPYLECQKDCLWSIKNANGVCLQLFQEFGKKVDRSKGIMIDKYLNCFQYDDFQVKEL